MLSSLLYKSARQGPRLRRVVAKSKSSSTQNTSPGLYVPYIPPNLVADTVIALKDRESTSEILNFLASESESTDVDFHRRLYQRTWEAFSLYQQQQRQIFLNHEQHLQRCMYEAIEQLPPNLYKEAVACTNLPHELALHAAYRHDWITSLSDYEAQKLDAFRMFSYLRFPFLTTRERQPGLFWIEQSRAISRQKQALLAKRK